MNRFDFGILVASLRNDLRLTQQELAHRAGLSVSAVSFVERGVRRGLLKDDLVLKLALGLQLTSFERREFLRAASGIEEILIPRHNEEAIPQIIQNRILSDIASQISRVALPVFITDDYCDILLANHIALAFYPGTAAMLENATTTFSSRNQAAYIFHSSSSYLELYGSEREKPIMGFMQYFRRQTILVRHTRRFKFLLQELLDTAHYPLFARYWYKMLHDPADKYIIDLPALNPDSDFNFYETDSVVALTPHGRYYWHQASPLNEKTAARILKIARTTAPACTHIPPFSITDEPRT